MVAIGLGRNIRVGLMIANGSTHLLEVAEMTKGISLYSRHTLIELRGIRVHDATGGISSRHLSGASQSSSLV